jgi:hypothetical protein
MSSKFVTFQGTLSSCKLADGGYLVKLGDAPLVTYVAEQLPEGGQVTIALRQMEGCPIRSFTCQGRLDVFMMKEIVEYYENGWRLVRKSVKVKHRVLLGGTPLDTRLAEFFEHKIQRYYYQHGLFEITIAE